jgi:hypothetical protein
MQHSPPVCCAVFLLSAHSGLFMQWFLIVAVSNEVIGCVDCRVLRAALFCFADQAV